MPGYTGASYGYYVLNDANQGDDNAFVMGDILSFNYWIERLQKLNRLKGKDA